ncbi:lysophospholipid acyltransferase family protein [Saccharopolyspora cebuensis]|uniref:Lysophospholipid acyltransferase family protein n=1 Tax=Saccharopolyspora cebuensis TaxID=418759 RepID=A0ABV4CQF2_9PSEU
MNKTNQYFPEHPCDLRCLPEDEDEVEVVGEVRFLLRRLAMRALYPAAWCAGVLGAALPRSAGAALFRWWARAWLAASGVRVRISGELGSDPVLLIANHVSYFDALAFVAARPCTITAAHDMRADRFLGRFLSAAGTIYLERDRLSALRRFVGEVAEELRSGRCVVAFPEGRIRCSAPGGAFAPTVLQAAVDAGVPVRPVLLWCERPDGRPTSRLSWLGDEGLHDSLRRVQRMRGAAVRVQVLPDLDPGLGRAELARRADAALAEAGAHLPDTCISGPALARGGVR